MATNKKPVSRTDIVFDDKIITLRSVYDKANIKYFIQPCKNKYGQYPSCIKRVNSQGDMIMSEKERNDYSEGRAVFFPENHLFTIVSGRTYNLNDPYDKAEWEAIENCPLIAKSRDERDSNGNLLIDGAKSTPSKPARNGVAELYIDRPGFESTRRVTRKKQILQASNFIMNDERGYEGRVLIARVLGRNMNNQPNSVVEDYLLSVAEKTPEKIIDCYTGGDLNLRMLFIQARENKVIVKRNGLYMYGESTVLGTTDDAVIDWMKQVKNAKTLTLIRRESFPEMYEDDEFDETPS